MTEEQCEYQVIVSRARKKAKRQFAGVRSLLVSLEAGNNNILTAQELNRLYYVLEDLKNMLDAWHGQTAIYLVRNASYPESEE
jgi:hypothetical protein